MSMSTKRNIIRRGRWSKKDVFFGSGCKGVVKIRAALEGLCSPFTLNNVNLS